MADAELDVGAFTCHSNEKIQANTTAIPAIKPEVTEMKQVLTEIQAIVEAETQ
jgi:hypothetical protein